MLQIDTLDVAVLVIIFLASTAYFTKGKYWGVPKDPYTALYAQSNGVKQAKSRDIVELMERSGKNCVIFYGSQTGTAEDYASRLSKEGASRFGLKTMVADLEDYDFENLDAFPSHHMAFFVLATYGEGEPTDNAADFYEFITDDSSSYSQGGSADDSPLSNMRFVAFGLGNSTYEHYNATIRNVSSALRRLGASVVGTVGEGNDGTGTLEEDFLTWKEPMWMSLKKEFGLEERESIYVPSFDVVEGAEVQAASQDVFMGELNKAQLEGNQRGPYGPLNPFVASIGESKELFTSDSRNCLHMEIRLEGSKLSYETGDHIAIWPSNVDSAVDRFLRVFGLLDKRNEVVGVTPKDATSKAPFPSPSTYDAVARYYLEICGPVSRQFLAQLTPFASSPSLSHHVKQLAGDRESFTNQVSSRHLDLATCLQESALLASAQARFDAPFSLLVEGLNRMQPRYYSISSSALLHPKTPSITAVVEVKRVSGSNFALQGVTTNYLLALKQKQHGEKSPDPRGLSYALDGPRKKYQGTRIPVHVRKSNFRLPKSNAIPVIMVGPGTGVAPFRGFVQERVHMAARGQPMGPTLLFFGCRTQKEDFIYRDEWQALGDASNGQFEVITAFSRDQAQRVYVQDRMKEKASQISLLLEEGAHFYVCGDAMRMAREVNSTLISLIASERDVSQTAAEDEIKRLRATGHYQEDVWS